MRGRLQVLASLVLAWQACSAANLQAIRVVNLGGPVTVRPTPGEQPEYRVIPAGANSACREEYSAETETLSVRCPEGAQANVEVHLPVGMPVAVETRSGAISFSGLSTAVSLSTDTGDVRITVPWVMMRLAGFSLVKPKRVSAQRGIVVRTLDQPRQWLITAGKTSSPEVPLEGAFFGEIRFRGGSPGRLELEDMPAPRYSWVKPPAEAAELLNAWLKQKPTRRNPQPAPLPPAGDGAEPGLPVFSASVRMVNLSVAVTDREGRPAPGLRPEDFEVLEEGTPQELAAVRSEEVPFNLVLLLDLSGSTKGYREAMKEVARRFIGVARRQDKVAVYAVANGLFYVLARLSGDRAQLLDRIDGIPPVEGQTPLYDCIFLSFAEELMERQGERNAMIVITDGIDSSLSQVATPGRSVISPKELREASSRMDVLIYPVLVGTDDWPLFAAAARRNLTQAAQASGGRVFEAKSIEALEPVYAMVAEELRSVYTLAYYPKNQTFDGRWRKIHVRVKKPGLAARTRDGYFAW